MVPDERVAAYKGYPPLLNHAERMEIIAACRWVDSVIPNGPKLIDRDFMLRNCFDIYAFGTSGPLELAAKLADCADLPEHMRVQLPYSQGISSSAIKARMRHEKGEPTVARQHQHGLTRLDAIASTRLRPAPDTSLSLRDSLDTALRLDPALPGAGGNGTTGRTA